MKRIVLFFALLLSVLSAEMSWEIPERKGEQFLSEEGYLFIPAPYSLPGIGEGVGLFSSFNNYFDRMDIFAMKLTGDVEGHFLGLWDVFLIEDTFFLDFTYQKLNKFGVSSYSSRGLDSNPDDYSVLIFNEYHNRSLKGTLSFFERRFEIIGRYSQGQSKLSSITDSEGTLIQNLSNSSPTDTRSRSLMTILDLTDDRQNPIKGIRGEIRYEQSDPSSDADPAYYTLNYNLTGYIPINNKDTFVINAFRSDAVVTRQGETDLTLIAQDLGFSCGGSCSQTIQNVIDNKYKENTLGNAQGIGGASRLRSYPGSRYIGAHSEAVGFEYRWNMAAERKPFDLYFMKDIRTGVQFALFHEIATVADDRRDLWSDTRSSSGIGARFVMGSGVVYRFDFATGREGNEMSIIVDYPWESNYQ
jgi:outer membrane protein assembly factor BamA